MNGEPRSPIPAFCGIRSTHYMYARYNGGVQELYDLRRDPYELRNIASRPSSASVIANMRALLRRECVPPPPGYQP
jgi:hypothetical protein